MFLHGGWMHILGNALFFWVFGNNIEDSMGPGRFLLFFLICGLAAAAAHILVQPDSPIPTVGASGAIAGILGAYLVLYPRVRVNMLFIFVVFIKIIPIPAWVVLIYWFIVQVLERVVAADAASARSLQRRGGVGPRGGLHRGHGAHQAVRRPPPRRRAVTADRPPGADLDGLNDRGRRVGKMVQ